MDTLQSLSQPLILELDDLAHRARIAALAHTLREPIDADGWGDSNEAPCYLGDGEVDAAVRGMIAACEADCARALLAGDIGAAREAAEEAEALRAELEPSPYSAGVALCVEEGV